ncbi:MAG: hypothetical protein K2X59_12145 [Sphingomonas sp.]|nr:hypothetical protein [Sphingomonas sp.]
MDGRAALERRYRHLELPNNKNLRFTLDGKLVGDLGEAIAAEIFDLKPVPGRQIDAYTRGVCEIPVQIKATGRQSGTFQFRKSKSIRHENVHLIAIQFDWQNLAYEIVYNGPESKVRPAETDLANGPVVVKVCTMRDQNRGLRDDQRLIPNPKAPICETP